uniref:Uncharacterized protein n=1 Tax=Glossina austeni TaxID=7395 RepID=A0A1A9VHP9_GLOAU
MYYTPWITNQTMFKEGLHFNLNDYVRKEFATMLFILFAKDKLCNECCWMIILIHLRAYMGFVISVVLLSSLRWAMRDFFYFLTLELLFALQIIFFFEVPTSLMRS